MSPDTDKAPTASHNHNQSLNADLTMDSTRSSNVHENQENTNSDKHTNDKGIKIQGKVNPQIHTRDKDMTKDVTKDVTKESVGASQNPYFEDAIITHSGEAKALKSTEAQVQSIKSEAKALLKSSLNNSGSIGNSNTTGNGTPGNMAEPRALAAAANSIISSHNGSNNVSTLSTPSVEVETVLFPSTGDYLTTSGTSTGAGTGLGVAGAAGAAATDPDTGANKLPEAQTPGVISDEYTTDDAATGSYRPLTAPHNTSSQILHQHPSLHSHSSNLMSASALKVKKSVDNVKTSKKKKSSRPATTKAEKFAAKIARAVDEVDSSDSDETFVYDSNPMSSAPGLVPSATAASSSSSHQSAQPGPGEPSSVSTVRPRFQSRNASASSLPAFEGLANGLTSSVPGLTTDSNSGSENNARRNSINDNPNTNTTSGNVNGTTNGIHATDNLTQTPLLTSSDFSEQGYYGPENSSEMESSSSQFLPAAAARLPSYKRTSPSHKRATLGSPRVASSTAAMISSTSSSGLDGPGNNGAGGTNTAAGGAAAKYSSLNGNSQLPLPNLRGKPSRMFAVAANNSSNNGNNLTSGSSINGSAGGGGGSASNSISGGGTGKNSRRWRNALSARYMDEEDDDESEGDIDEDDDYLDTIPSETTPLRHSIHGLHSMSSHVHSNSGGMLSRGLRSSRKNGNVVLYSPHNYRQHSQASQRFYFVRIVLWVLFFLVFVLGFGFTLGFLLATSKPLQDVYITNVFNILASDEELAFEMVLLGFNPGLLSVTIDTCDLDVFARSPYVADPDDDDDDDDDDGLWDRVTQEATEHTMRLGTVTSFDVPIVFEGGFFDHRMFKAVGDIRLKNPGLNSTIDDDDGGFIAKPGKKVPERDDGQKRWSRVSVHPFDLSVRGVLHYELFMGRKNSLSVSKTLRVDPDQSSYSLV